MSISNMLSYGPKGNLSLDYELKDKIGEGQFGEIFKGIHKRTKKSVAVKIISKYDLKKNNESTIEKFIKEAEILKICNHPHVVRYMDCYEDDINFYLVMEYVAYGDLYTYIESHGPLSEEKAKDVFAQIVSAIEYCQANLIAHRDLKLENILISDTKKITVKIADFGLATFINVNDNHKTKCGSIHYVAPEVITDADYNPLTSDIWSIGVILYCITTGKFPWTISENMKDTIHDIVTYNYHEPYAMSSGFTNLLERIFCNYKNRISISDIKKHPWLRNNVIPSYLPEMKKVTQIDCDIVNKLVSLGFNIGDVYTAIHNNIQTPVTIMYYTLMNQYGKILDLQNNVKFVRIKEKTSILEVQLERDNSDSAISKQPTSDPGRHNRINKKKGKLRLVSPRRVFRKKLKDNIQLDYDDKPDEPNIPIVPILDMTKVERVLSPYNVNGDMDLNYSSSSISSPTSTPSSPIYTVSDISDTEYSDLCVSPKPSDTSIISVTPRTPRMMKKSPLKVLTNSVEKSELSNSLDSSDSPITPTRTATGTPTRSPNKYKLLKRTSMSPRSLLSVKTPPKAILPKMTTSILAKSEVSRPVAKKCTDIIDETDHIPRIRFSDITKTPMNEINVINDLSHMQLYGIHSDTIHTTTPISIIN